MQPLSGFRDFYPDACASRNYLFALWRDVARRFGFTEVDGPILEPTELYRKKSGGELMGQLYQFIDKGERDVALRPEMTPTVARMIGTRSRDFKKPVKWFSIGRFFRFERPQAGRLREFYQLNCDIFGETSMGADAELIALAIEIFRAAGFSGNDLMVRMSTRDIWSKFLTENGGNLESLPDFLNIIDKMEREAETALEAKLQPFGVTLSKLRDFMSGERFEAIEPLVQDLEARGLGEFVKVDPAIVRGLAYYTGAVFEVFDRSMEARALAGGGRYDELVGKLCGSSASLPAVGFGMGDVVLGDLISKTPEAAAKREAWMKENARIDLYLVIADDSRRPSALQWAQKFRTDGLTVELPLGTAPKVGKQFQTAEQLGANYALVIGSEFPAVKLKKLATREEETLSIEEVCARIRVVM